ACNNRPNFPIHVDRLYSGGGNSRQAFEAILARTPHFFVCKPDRVDVYTGEIQKNLKHIMWCPDETHILGEIKDKPYREVITEVELGLDFGQIQITEANLGKEFSSIEAKTTHIQMQIALI